MKSYADLCLERANSATPGPWDEIGGRLYPDGQNEARWEDYEFIAHSRTDVPELARRLKKACEKIRRVAGKLQDSPQLEISAYPLFQLADELEAMPEGEK